MRVTLRQVAKVMLKLKSNPKLLKRVLRYFFSFKENIGVYARVCFPEALTNKSPEFHEEIYKKLFELLNSAFAAPRGSAKSTVVGLVFISFCVVNNLEKYIVYISQNHAKTVQFLTPLRYEFKQNKMLQFIYGDLTPSKSRDDDGKDREDCLDVNNIRIEAVSFEKNMRGFKYKNTRPTLIIGDDIESDERVINPDLRLKDEDKLNRVIIPALDIKGRFKFIGTILHINSLLKKKITQYNGKIYQAIDSQGKLLWPDRYTKDILMQIKKDIGSLAYQQEYLNDPVDDTSSLIKREWLDACKRADLSYRELQAKSDYSMKTMGADFAFSDRITADESAYCSLGKKDEFYYLFHCEKLKGWSVNDQLMHIKLALHKRFRYDQIGLEENSIKAVSKDLTQYNLPITLFWTAASDPKKAKPGAKDFDYNEKRYTVGKTNLIMRLGTAFENKRIILPYKNEEDKRVTDLVVAECSSFALANGKLVEAGTHPDIPIGLGYALELMEKDNEAVVLW